MPDAAPERSRFLSVLGVLCLLMGVWGGFFVAVAYDMFDQMVSRSGPPGGPYREGPRADIEPWVLGYCAISAVLTLLAGIGLLLRRRWGPALASFAGASWTVTSFGVLWSEVRLLTRGTMAPPSYRQAHEAYAGGTVIALIFGLFCLSCLIRRSSREECAARSPGWILGLALLAWSGAAATVTMLWYDWHWKSWGF